MNIRVLNRKAQSTLEYVGVIIVIITVFIVAGVYFQRSLQGKYRQTGDSLSGGEQYTSH